MWAVLMSLRNKHLLRKHRNYRFSDFTNEKRVETNGGKKYCEIFSVHIVFIYYYSLFLLGVCRFENNGICYELKQSSLRLLLLSLCIGIVVTFSFRAKNTIPKCDTAKDRKWPDVCRSWAVKIVHRSSDRARASTIFFASVFFIFSRKHTLDFYHKWQLKK